MITVTVQIGNSDDKLSQGEWSGFVAEVNDRIVHGSEEVFFFGTSDNTKPWQNACWVYNPGEASNHLDLIDNLKEIREDYQQESIAVNVSMETRFI